MGLTDLSGRCEVLHSILVRRKTEDPGVQAMKSNRILVVCFLAVCILPCDAEEPCLKNAWSAFNRNAYEAAMRAADSCIDEFGAKAQRDQSAFDARREPEPPVGAVSDADKQKIFSRGVLNDVGAAYFVKGRSAGALVRAKKREDYRSIATQAYTMAIN